MLQTIATTILLVRILSPSQHRCLVVHIDISTGITRTRSEWTIGVHIVEIVGVGVSVPFGTINIGEGKGSLEARTITSRCCPCHC
uniref:Putative secreted protein n=1 Tax=Anopheles marajoara TaxID=58244 RepID=A0A2M4CAW1_9DIPT